MLLLIPICIGFLIGGLAGAAWAVLITWGLMFLIALVGGS